MNTITNAEVNTKQLNILNKNGFTYYEQLARLKPKKLYDCREEVVLNDDICGHGGMIIGELLSIEAKKASSGMEMTRAYIRSEKNGCRVSLTWFHTKYPAERYESSVGKRVLAFGKIEHDSYGADYKIVAPILFTDYTEKYEGKIIPAYKKYRGLSDDYFSEIINNSTLIPLDEPFSDSFRQKTGLMSLNDLSQALHNPTDINDLTKGYGQVDLEDLTYFATKLIQNTNTIKDNVPVIIKHEIFDKAISDLPFELTSGQKETLENIKKGFISKETLNNLVQGDVSCGKSIVAYLTAILVAENGYQVAILAPTVVLASQHYEDAGRLFEKYGFRTGFINGTLKKKEKIQLEKDLAEGNINILIGTHAATSDSIKFNNLGLVIIDEEQRFGVTCREKLKTKSDNPVFYISMSATPIPRTLASCIYGEGTGIYSIKSMPNGRQSVDTIIYNKFCIPKILLKELSEGRQAYVVCALIDENEDDDENPIVSVEKTKKYYEKALPGYRIEVLTGKTKEADTLQIMQDFKSGLINVLISTTVIEVGVNNPNASVIVIQNAERFGLSTLHQLRGRVRRGSYKPYCILMTTQEDNERLNALASTEDGFTLSEMDLNLRKSGNLIGTEQSGKNHFVELLISKPKFYEIAKDYARQLINSKESDSFIETMNKIYGFADE